MSDYRAPGLSEAAEPAFTIAARLPAPGGNHAPGGGEARQQRTSLQDVQPYRSARVPQQAFAVNCHPTGSEILSSGECLQLLASAPVGRVVYSDQALPAVQPVDFVVDDGAVVIRTGDGSRLARAVNDAVVAFEADELDTTAGSGWSVTVVGECSDISEPGHVKRLSTLVSRRWVTDGDDHFVRISIAGIAGRRVHPAG